MRSIAFAFFLVFCLGCKHGYPVTDQAPFAGYMGRDLTLKRTAVLIKSADFEIGPPAMKDASFTNSSDFRYFRLVGILPAGTVVRLDKIDFAWDEEAGAGAFIARGRTVSLDTSRNTKFEYFWGIIDKIDRAPWDGDAVPLERYVLDSNGRKLVPQYWHSKRDQ